jgi:glycerol kinase
MATADGAGVAPAAADGPLVLAIDQGTSATKAVVVDTSGAIVARGSVPLAQTHPRPGWAEQDAQEIWASAQASVSACLERVDPGRVVAVGLSTQRESMVLWERATGRPVGPLLGWQDGRGAALCAQLRERGYGERVRAVSGLPLDPMFSSSKATWLLDTYDPDRSRSSRGELCLGTVDSWLLARLGGEHLVEAGNASRTQLLDLATRQWDPWLLDLFRVPVQALPRVVGSAGPFTRATGLPSLPSSVPVTAVLGDSHAALFAHAGWRPGQVKATYGTGSSVMGLTDKSSAGSAGLCRTIAWDISEPRFALEGNIRSSGATLTWLARLFGTEPSDLAGRAAATSEGVHLVPAFSGLGAPWWDDAAVAVLDGMSFGTGPEHLARAALESIAFQIEDVVAEIEREAGPVETVLADGGPTSNSTLMQLQADTSGRLVARARARDLSALGAAHAAGLGAGVWTWNDIESLPREREPFSPSEDDESRNRRVTSWHQAVARSRLTPGS